MASYYFGLDGQSDLSTSSRASANTMVFVPETHNLGLLLGSELTSTVRTDGPDYTKSSIYQFTAKAGATYHIHSTSFFEPWIKLYDQNGKPVARGDLTDDWYSGSSSYDSITRWKAPYDGVFYIDPGWDRGVAQGHRSTSLTVDEDTDSSGWNTSPAPAPVPAPLAAALPAVLMAPAPRPDATLPAASNVQGTDAADTLQGGNGMDLIYGGNGNDAVTAGAGNDFVRGGGGNDRLNGGSGIDTAQFAGPYSAYAVTVDRSTNTIQVAHNAGGADGTDVTSNFEFYQFGDRIVPASQLWLLNAPQIKGTDASDTQEGTAEADIILPGQGNNQALGNGGNDMIVASLGSSNSAKGGGGIDTLFIDTASANVTVTKYPAHWAEAKISVEQNNVLDADMERVQLKDKYFVLDLEPGNNGYKAALLAYALKGSAGLRDGDLMAKTLAPLFDSFFSMADVSSYLIDSGYMAGLAGGTSNAQLVTTLFKAVIGSAPDSATVAELEAAITSGNYTQATFLAGVAQLELVGAAVNFPQYATNGLALSI